MRTEFDHRKLKLSWTKYDIVRVADIVESRDDFQQFYDRKKNIDDPILRGVIGISANDSSIPPFWDKIFELDVKVRKAFVFWWIVLTSYSVYSKFIDKFTKGKCSGSYIHKIGKVETNLRSLIFKCEITTVCDRKASEVPFDASLVLSVPGKVFRAALENLITRHSKNYDSEELDAICIKSEFHKTLGLTEEEFLGWINEARQQSHSMPFINSIRFDKFLCFVDPINISFNNSKEVYITGENGVGKTTLLKAIFLTFKAFSILQNYSEIESFAVIANQLSKIGSSSLLGYDSEGHESKIESDSHITTLISYGSNRCSYLSDHEMEAKDHRGFMTLFCDDILLSHPSKILSSIFANCSDSIKNEVIELINEITQGNVELSYENDKVLYFENGNIVDFSDISSGYKNLVLLCSDLIYNLSRKSDNVFQSTGVVMIDSIEQSLHPSIQAGLFRIIRNHFPNIQFFVTTQSHIVLDSASAEAVKIELRRTNNKLVVNNITLN